MKTITHYILTVGFLTVVFANVSYAGDWVIEIFGDPSSSADVALDSDGYPHIAYFYYDTSEDEYAIKYKYWDGDDWVTTEPETYNGYIGSGASIELDSYDNPRLVYGKGNELRYAYYDGETWYISTVFESEGYVGATDLKLTSSGGPRIVFHDPYDEKDLYYALPGVSPSSWDIFTITSQGDVGQHCSLALDSNDVPHISCFKFYELGDAELIYATVGMMTPWAITVVDSDGYVGFWSTIDVDSDDYPHIAYVDWNDYPDTDIKYAYWDGRDWNVSSILSSTNYPWPSIALNYDDEPRISYEADDGKLHLASYDGSWSTEVVDNYVNSRWISTSLTLDRYDNPYIAYGSPKGLRYAYWDPEGRLSFGPGTDGLNAACEVVLAQTSPNPATGSITFNFTLSSSTKVNLSIYDLSGRKVTTVIDEVKEAGDHTIVFDGHLTPGVYIYKLATPDSTAVKKMVVTE